MHPTNENIPSIHEVIDTHYQSVYRFAFRLSGSASDADDLTQQTFLQACRKLDQLRDEQRIRSWLLTITRNTYLKGVQRDRLIDAELDDDLVVDEESTSGLDFDEERLHFALSELPDSHRIPLLMFYFEELSYKEIAEQLELPIGTVMSRLARAKRQLRESLSTVEFP